MRKILEVWTSRN